MGRLLQSYLDECNLQVTEEQGEQLTNHLRLVLQANQDQNLTAIREANEALRLHTVDSLLALVAIPEDAVRLVDIGSGQGYPAIPLAILRPTMRVAMIEANSRKARFLQFIVSEMGLGERIEVVNDRAESVAEDHGELYCVATARAVASLAALVELAAPLLRQSGILVAMKGLPEATEYRMADRAAMLCGMSPGKHDGYLLPGGGESRTISVFKKVGSPAVTLPRRVGRAQKRPLK